MKERRYEIALYRREREQITLEVLASSAGLHPALVEHFVEFGLLTPVEWAGRSLLFDVAALPRLRMIERLRCNIGVNLAGVSVILDMLERLRAAQREIDWLHSQL